MSRHDPEVPLEEEDSHLDPTPEQRLMAAILRRAIWDYVFYRDVRRDQDEVRYTLAADAAGWLFWDGTEHQDDQGRFTFWHICESLGVDPGHIRIQVQKLQIEDVKKLHNAMKDT